jgi:hypothetical protein
VERSSKFVKVKVVDKGGHAMYDGSVFQAHPYLEMNFD